jgi:lipid A 3-O-deacylase
MFLKKISLLLIIVLTATKLFAAEEVNTNEHQLNFFAGNFDFSDDKQKAILVGFEHQNESLNRDTMLGNVSPITGGFVTECGYGW